MIGKGTPLKSVCLFLFLMCLFTGCGSASEPDVANNIEGIVSDNAAGIVLHTPAEILAKLHDLTDIPCNITDTTDKFQAESKVKQAVSIEDERQYWAVNVVEFESEEDCIALFEKNKLRHSEQAEKEEGYFRSNETSLCRVSEANKLKTFLVVVNTQDSSLLISVSYNFDYVDESSEIIQCLGISLEEFNQIYADAPDLLYNYKHMTLEDIITEPVLEKYSCSTSDTNAFGEHSAGVRAENLDFFSQYGQLQATAIIYETGSVNEASILFSLLSKVKEKDSTYQIMNYNIESTEAFVQAENEVDVLQTCTVHNKEDNIIVCFVCIDNQREACIELASDLGYDIQNYLQ